MDTCYVQGKVFYIERQILYLPCVAVRLSARGNIEFLHQRLRWILDGRARLQPVSFTPSTPSVTWWVLSLLDLPLISRAANGECFWDVLLLSLVLVFRVSDLQTCIYPEAYLTSSSYQHKSGRLHGWPFRPRFWSCHHLNRRPRLCLRDGPPRLSRCPHRYSQYLNS
jgi:hypothetical protein